MKEFRVKPVNNIGKTHCHTSFVKKKKNEFLNRKNVVYSAAINIESPRMIMLAEELWARRQIHIQSERQF